VRLYMWNLFGAMFILSVLGTPSSAIKGFRLFVFAETD
jgi:hypothetical protein